MALTTEDLGQIKGVVHEVVDGAILSSEQRVMKHIDGGLAGLEVQMNDGFEQVIATIDGHMVETDRRFISVHKRLERLE